MSLACFSLPTFSTNIIHHILFHITSDEILYSLLFRGHQEGKFIDFLINVAISSHLLSMIDHSLIPPLEEDEEQGEGGVLILT